LDLVQIVDTPEEAIQIVLDYLQKVGPPEEIPPALQ
jgi:hypothetical protein